ncbi:polyhydroxyalkanoate synthesis regulator DNA-binding domain-containing protein [Methylobacterium fujisawaense]|uniref:polyhydroxyalkanoate synthesis regulator DNA-binding domain-containing protein n=1 Tax=Methylobacterium fujisawaense TaxID=107400 RepID=UPI00313B217F
MPRKRRPRRLINRYATSRLYDVETRAYVTLDHLKDLRSAGYEVVVREVETGRFVTEDVLKPGLDA